LQISAVCCIVPRRFNPKFRQLQNHPPPYRHLQQAGLLLLPQAPHKAIHPTPAQSTSTYKPENATQSVVKETSPQPASQPKPAAPAPPPKSFSIKINKSQEEEEEKKKIH
jgi:hypothetical protein